MLESHHLDSRMAPQSDPGTSNAATKADALSETFTQQYRRWREFAELAEILGDGGDASLGSVVPDLTSAEEIVSGVDVEKDKPAAWHSKRRNPADTDAA